MTITHDSDQVLREIKESNNQDSVSKCSMGNVITARQASILAKDSCVVRVENLISDTFDKIKTAAENGQCSIRVFARSYDLNKLQERLEGLDYCCRIGKVNTTGLLNLLDSVPEYETPYLEIGW